VDDPRRDLGRDQAGLSLIYRGSAREPVPIPDQVPGRLSLEKGQAFVRKAMALDFWRLKHDIRPSNPNHSDQSQDRSKDQSQDDFEKAV
jgi:hypothetical protein